MGGVRHTVKLRLRDGAPFFDVTALNDDRDLPAVIFGGSKKAIARLIKPWGWTANEIRRGGIRLFPAYVVCSLIDITSDGKRVYTFVCGDGSTVEAIVEEDYHYPTPAEWHAFA